VIKLLLMTVSMIAVGVIVYRLLEKQEPWRLGDEEDGPET